MKKVYIKDLRVGMFVEELDGPWLKTPFPLQGMLIQSPKDIKALGIYCEYVYVSAKKNMKKVLIENLEVGMFVEELDRPWLETPFSINGMEILSQEDIEELGKYCQYVFISLKKKPATPPPALEEEDTTPTKYNTHVIPEESQEKTQFHGDYVYDTTLSFEEEIPVAKKAHEKATLLINQIKEDIDRDFKLDLDTAKELVDVIAASIIKNPAAMLFLNQLNASDSSHYDHALNTSIHMITFGRHLCLPAEELYILGLGGLLMDIGQLKQSDSSQTSKSNYNSSVEHVIEGQKILSQIPSIPAEVIRITAQHHERENGKGYPLGLGSNQISTYARMAAIVDIYECLISQGLNDSPPLSPFEALKTLWDMTRTGLNATLVQQFAHCIGLFPSGSLVELNTGEIAIVITQSRTNRLLPTVMIVLDKHKQPYSAPITIDLATSQAKMDGKHKYEIVLDLKPGAYGIDPKEYYL